MSDLLRRCIQRSLDDLIAMMHLYKDGNNYKGEYHILRDLAVAKLKQPSTIFLVSILISAFESFRMNNYAKNAKNGVPCHHIFVQYRFQPWGSFRP